MRQIRTSGLMSGDGKRGGATSVSTRVRPRLYPMPNCRPCGTAQAVPDTMRNFGIQVNSNGAYTKRCTFSAGNPSSHHLQPRSTNDPMRVVEDAAPLLT